MIGVTNPYFLKAAAAMPNLLALPSRDDLGALRTSASAGDAIPSQEHVPRLSSVASATAAIQSLFRSESSIPQLPGGAAAGVWLGYQGTSAGFDKAVLAKLMARQRTARVSGASGVLSDRRAMQHTLRSHFWHLTVAFMSPFCDYCGVKPSWIKGNRVCAQLGAAL
jgi:hypothetical protein